MLRTSNYPSIELCKEVFMTIKKTTSLNSDLSEFSSDSEDINLFEKKVATLSSDSSLDDDSADELFDF